MTTIDDARVARFLAADAKLRKGTGSGVNGQFDACIMQVVDYITGGDGSTDHPPCADVVITAFAIRLNDAARFAQWRDELKPYAIRIAGTRPLDAAAALAARERRRYMCADWAVRTIAPLACEFWADLVPARREEALGIAAELRAVAPIVDRATSLAARKTAQKAQSAASVARRAAYAAAAAADAAADAAYAAAAAADAAAAAAADAAAAYAAAAYADAAAADAAAAAAYADAAASYAGAPAAARSKSKAFERKMWDESLAQLDALIRVTETA